VARVARLFSKQFQALHAFCRQHAGFVEDSIARFDEELQFFLAYLDYLVPLRAAGLRFCLPELTAGETQIFALETYDLALAHKRVAGGAEVVSNDFELRNGEHVIVVSGPNQGGKTTFARMFGQLHHLASLGCPVPGASARLRLPDAIYTHFEQEEDLADLRGKLEDDLVRIAAILRAASASSIVIMNEIFTSTTLHDASFLGRKVMDKLVELGCLSVYVTFVDELACYDDSVVSMTSTIVPGHPAERTYRIVRAPANGLAYALALADKHGLTYEQLSSRLSR
ncbi:MAG TPA: hypothetical protein VMD59_17270, partial [Acidimicrobiales bacterium]|nr:hypothetical protein [Acidimicrobiales bacterium]